MPLAAFDLETTSADPHTARIVSACVLRVDCGYVAARNWIADPGIPIPAEATAVHGISTEYAQKHGHPHDQVVADVVGELGAVFSEGRALAIYNAGFDLTLMAAREPTFSIGDGLIVDPFVLDKQFDRFRRGSRKLSAVAIHYGMRLDDAHDAEADALAAARLAWKMPRLYPTLANLTPVELMKQQAAWYRAQAKSLAEYLARQGKPSTDISLDWPIRRANESNAA